MTVRTNSGRLRLPFLMLLFGYALFSINGWLRVAGTIIQWEWLEAARVFPGPLYLALSGALWGFIGLAALIWVARQLPRYRPAGLALALVIALTYWFDRLLFRIQESSLPNTAFSVAFTIFAVAFACAVLYSTKEAGLPAWRLRR